MRRYLEDIHHRGAGELDLTQPLSDTLTSGANAGTSVVIGPGEVRQVANFRGAWVDGSLLVSLTRSDIANPNFDGSDVAAVDADVYAQIAYGGGANSETVEVDWLTGTTLHIPGSFAHVSAVYPRLDAIISDVTPAAWSIQCGAMVTLGRKSAEGATGTARRTVRVLTASGTETARLAIPTRAISMRVQVMNSLADILSATEVRLLSVPVSVARPGTSILQTMAGAPSWTPHEIELPNSARSFTLRQTSMAAIRYAVTFTLAL